MSFDINIYGCGNMTSAIFIGLSNSPISFKVHTFTPSFTRAQNLASKLGGIAYKELKDLPKSKYYFIGVKPQQFESLALELKKHISRDATIISIMAGISLSRLQLALGVSKVIKVMPSTPSLVGKGISLIIKSNEVNEPELEEVKNLFKGVSKVINVKSEDELNRLTTVSASGPAYIFELARIFSSYLKSSGVSGGTSDLVAAHLIEGSAKLMIDSHESFETLRNNVTSKGGMTFEALEVLKNNNLESIFKDALDAAYKRGKELAK